jgi:hypothetical protein
MSLNSEATQSDWDNGKLPALLAAYREACPDPDPDPNFMPSLWQKIEARQTLAFTVQRVARAFLTVAAAICILLSVALVTARSHHPMLASGTYVEMLAAEQAPEGFDIADLGHSDNSGEAY